MASTSRGAVDLPGLFSDLVRCETRLYNELNVRLRDRHQIVTSQFEGLRYLRDHPGSRVADLAAEFVIGIGATSKVVDRMERRGLLTRRPNPADRRSSLLHLTREGVALVEEAELTFTGTLAELVTGTLDAAAVDATAAALARLRAALEAAGAGTPTG